MPGYIGLLKYTQQGLADIKNGPERINQSKALAQKMGIRPIGTWVTLGPYDLVIVGEAPDDQTIAAFNLALARAGSVTSTTMRALSEEEKRWLITKTTGTHNSLDIIISGGKRIANPPRLHYRCFVSIRLIRFWFRVLGMVETVNCFRHLVLM